MKKSNSFFWWGIFVLLVGVFGELLDGYLGDTTSKLLDNFIIPFLIEAGKCTGTSLIIASFIPKTDDFHKLSEKQRKECVSEILCYEEDIKESNTDINTYFNHVIDFLFSLGKINYRTDYKYFATLKYDSTKKRIYSIIRNEYREYKVKGYLTNLYIGFTDKDAVINSMKMYDEKDKQIPHIKFVEQNNHNPKFPEDCPFNDDPSNIKGFWYQYPNSINENRYIRIEREITEYGKENSCAYLLGFSLLKPCSSVEVTIVLEDDIKLEDMNTFGGFKPEPNNRNSNVIRYTSHKWMNSGTGADFLFVKKDN